MAKISLFVCVALLAASAASALEVGAMKHWRCEGDFAEDATDVRISVPGTNAAVLKCSSGKAGSDLEKEVAQLRRELAAEKATIRKKCSSGKKNSALEKEVAQLRRELAAAKASGAASNSVKPDASGLIGGLNQMKCSKTLRFRKSRVSKTTRTRRGVLSSEEEDEEVDDLLEVRDSATNKGFFRNIAKNLKKSKFVRKALKKIKKSKIGKRVAKKVTTGAAKFCINAISKALGGKGKMLDADKIWNGLQENKPKLQKLQKIIDALMNRGAGCKGSSSPLNFKWLLDFLLDKKGGLPAVLELSNKCHRSKSPLISGGGYKCAACRAVSDNALVLTGLNLFVQSSSYDTKADATAQKRLLQFSDLLNRVGKDRWMAFAGGAFWSAQEKRNTAQRPMERALNALLSCDHSVGLKPACNGRRFECVGKCVYNKMSGDDTTVGSNYRRFCNVPAAGNYFNLRADRSRPVMASVTAKKIGFPYKTKISCRDSLNKKSKTCKATQVLKRFVSACDKATEKECKCLICSARGQYASYGVKENPFMKLVDASWSKRNAALSKNNNPLFDGAAAKNTCRSLIDFPMTECTADVMDKCAVKFPSFKQVARGGEKSVSLIEGFSSMASLKSSADISGDGAGRDFEIPPAVWNFFVNRFADKSGADGSFSESEWQAAGQAFGMKGVGRNSRRGLVDYATALT